MIESVLQDLRYGLRQLKQSPGFTAVAILSLALGIGANTAIFQLVNAILLKMLPVKNPQELVLVDFAKNSARAGQWSSRSSNFTYAQWDQIRQHQLAFDQVMAWSAERFNLALGGEPRFAEGLYVSGDFFNGLGVQPIFGRVFTSEDDSATCNAGAVISHAFWQREFAGNTNVLGRTVTLDGYSYPIVGVTPAAFFGVEVGSRYDVAIPLCADRTMSDDKKGRIPKPASWWLSIMGRLKPGWNAKSATAHLQAISPGIMRATLPASYKPDLAKRYLTNKLNAKEVGTGVSDLREQYERPLWLLMATTGLVLLIACANLANLLLARASVRETEVAVRLAVGASRIRLVRQLLAESLLLATGGAALGAGLAIALSRALILFISTNRDPLFVGTGLDWRTLGFTAGLALVTCLLFGLLPAWRATYLSPAASMRGGGRSTTAGRERFSLRRALVSVQVALSLVLLVGALLFVRSLHNLLTANAGFRPEGVLTVEIDFSKAQYAQERRLAVYRELSDSLSAIPGVQSVAQIRFTPVSGSGWNNSVGPDGAPAASSHKEAWFNRAGPGYFKTMDTRLIAGREFTEHDTLSSPKVAIVNEMFARKYFNGANPVGRTFHLEAEAGKPEPLMQIVGLVENTKYRQLREDFIPIGFFPIAQDETPRPGATFVLRVAGSPTSVMKAAQTNIAAMNPTIGIQFRSFSTQLEESLLRERLMATLSGAFGFLAGLLATLGLYGVIAYMVARRRNEIGVRIALGADHGRVIRLVLKEAVLLLLIGLAAGAVVALWAGRAAASLLYGLQPQDPVSLVTAALLLAVIALLASYGPARRAARLEPMAALRQE